MTQSQLGLLGGFVVLMAAALFLVGLGRRRTAIEIDERLAPYIEQPVMVVDDEMSAPFVDRMLKPAILALSRRVAALAPGKSAKRARAALEEAGNPNGLGVVEFLGLRYLLAIVVGGGALLLFSFSGGGVPLALLLALILGGLGYLLPGVWISRKIKQRKKELVLSLPDAIDLLTISVESGLGFDPALMRVAEKWDNALTREFARALSEMRIGKNRRDALREMATRTNVDDVRTFISAIVQADQLGVPISQVLRIQSEAMRIRRRQRAEELAHKAPIKMLFPMVFLIFPALYVVILGPAVPQIMQGFGR